MLYINVYLVSQQYGGPEEGSWYYDVGTPLASIPVDSDFQKGKSYFLQDGIHIQECYLCGGTGEVDVDPEDGSECYKGRCEDCGLVPEKPEEVWKEIQKYQDMYKDEPGRYEEIRVALESGFAQPYPSRKPHYE